MSTKRHANLVGLVLTAVSGYKPGVVEMREANAYSPVTQANGAQEPLVVFRPAGYPEGVYGIVHAASGLSVTGIEYWTVPSRAHRALKELAPLTDWAKGKEELPLARISPLVKTIVAKHGAKMLSGRVLDNLRKKEAAAASNGDAS